jgi:hypothetical protein
VTVSEEQALEQWKSALDRRSSLESLTRLALLDQGERVRFLSETVGENPGAEWWLHGSRSAFSSGLQNLAQDRLWPENQWWVRWLLGRWPRGHAVVGHPTDSEARLKLGLIAPLVPTRMALSEGPLPLSIEGVAHFKAVHAATQAPGLVGCRLEIEEQSLVTLAARWEVDLPALLRVAEIWGLAQESVEMIVPVIEGLSEGLKRAPTLVVEAPYCPDPSSSLVLEIGPVAARSSIGLANALLGVEAAGVLTELARDLSARRFFRVRVTLGPAGAASLTALAAPSSQVTVKSGW